MIVISIMCRVIFSEYYFKDHIGNKCTCMITCMFIACLSCIFVILLNKFISYHIIMYGYACTSFIILIIYNFGRSDQCVDILGGGDQKYPACGS